MSETNAETENKEESKKAPEIEEKSHSVSRSGKFGKVKVDYTATAATQVIGEDDHEKRAVFFYVSYVKEGADPKERPLLFAFNGGPGSSTVWLHLGLLGPKKVEMDQDGMYPVGRGQLVDNPRSILDVADVVAVDAIGTGFSTASPKDSAKEYHKFKDDIEAFAEFIVRYVNRNGRWSSPLYIMGESYGTTRGVGVAHELFTRHGTALAGLILVSSVLNFQTIAMESNTLAFHPGNELPYLTHLPTYAATAWYHGVLDKPYSSMELRKFLDEVEEFALGEYWTALAKGDRLSDEEFSSVASKLSAYTGLSEDYVRRYRLRIHIMRFCKELLRSQERTVGRIDSRYTGIDRFVDGANMEADPSMDATNAPFTAALNDYLRNDIGFRHESLYEILSEEVWKNWKYEGWDGRYVDVSEKLRDLLSRERGVKVLVANGYYDLATPHFGTEYTFGHLGIDPSIRDRISMEYYEAGHMMYVHPDSLDAMSGHVREFIRDTA